MKNLELRIKNSRVVIERICRDKSETLSNTNDCFASLAMTYRRVSTGFYIFFLCAFCLAPVTTSWAAPIEAKVKSVSGKVEFALAGSTEFSPLAAGQKLAAGSTVRTGEDGTAILVTLPGAAIRLEKQTQLILSEMDLTKTKDEKTGKEAPRKKAFIELKSGTVSALIHNKVEFESTDFKIKTPQGVAAARGTFFGVTVEEGKTFLAVKEGTVGVRKAEADQTQP